MNKPFNALFDPIPKNVSKNERAEKLMGLREEILKGAIPIDMPCELGYVCPVCKYDFIVDGDYDERLNWSEYNGFLWCAICNKDYPSCLCHPDLDQATKIFLDCIEEAKNSASPVPTP